MVTISGGGLSSGTKNLKSTGFNLLNQLNKEHGKQYYPAAPARPATPPRPTPAPRRNSGGGNVRSGGSYNAGSIASPAPAAPAAPKPISETDWLKGDSAYQAMLTALASQLGNFNTDIASQRDNYIQNFDQSVKDLGYLAPGADGGAASWNWQDPLTASGRAYTNLTNDFAARGMLQSSGFADSQNDLTRSLQDQYDQLNTGRQQFETGLTNQQAAYQNQNTSAQQQARAESIARRAAKYGLA